MASTETRPAFRLPWTHGPSESDEPSKDDAVEASTESE